MYTEKDVAEMLKNYNTGGAIAPPLAKNQYTAQDVSQMVATYDPNYRKPVKTDMLNGLGSSVPQVSKVQKQSENATHMQALENRQRSNVLGAAASPQTRIEAKQQAFSLLPSKKTELPGVTTQGIIPSTTQSLGVIGDNQTYDAVGDRVRAERYAIMQKRQGKTMPAALDTLKGTGIAPQVQRIADKGDSVTNADIDMLRGMRDALAASLPDNSIAESDYWERMRNGTLDSRTLEDQKTLVQIDALNKIIDDAKQLAEMSGERPTTTQRIGAGVQAIGRSTSATLPMLGAAAAQAGKDTIQNISNPEYRAALWERIKKGMDTEAMQRLDEATISNPVSLDSAGVHKMRESNQSRERMLEGLTPEQRFIGEGLYSVADNATTLPLAAINPSLPLYAMGTKAAAGRAYELTEQGKSAGEALTRGIISGVIEGATEKIPLDSVMDIIKTGGKTLAANMLKQTVIEAGEEGASYLLNYTADKLAKDPNAQFTVQELMRQMALGGFSGLIMAGGGTLANRVANVDMLSGLGNGATEQAAPPVASGTQQTAPDYKLGDLQPQEQPQNRQMLSAADALFEEQATPKAQMGKSMAADLDMHPKSEIQKSESQQDTRHILEKLKENIPMMQGVEAVTTLSGSEFSKGNKKLTETVGDFFRSLGNKVFRNGVGDVILDENGIKSDIAHGIGRAKAVTFAAIPDVIANGQQIDYQQNWKGRGYDTLVFSAPVKIGNQISYVATVVRKAKNSNRFYLHEVLDENGNVLYIKKESNSFKTGPGAETSATGELDSLDINIAQVANGVNNIISDSNAKNVAEIPENKVQQVTNNASNEFMQHYGVDSEEQLAAVASEEDWNGYLQVYAQDEQARINSLMDEIDNAELARRRASIRNIRDDSDLKSTVEMLEDADNGVIRGEPFGEDAKLLTNVMGAHNMDIARVLDATVRGKKKSDLPLSAMEGQRLRNRLYELIERPLQDAKNGYVDGVVSKSREFGDAMDKLSIKAGSRESAAVQWIGEGQRQVDGKILPYTQEDLQRDFPQDYQKINQAAEICRNIYDSYVNEINNTLKMIYPNVENIAAAERDKLNRGISYNNAQAQLWEKQAESLQSRMQDAIVEVHRAGSQAMAKTTERVNRLKEQRTQALIRAQRFTQKSEVFQQQAIALEEEIASGEVYRNKRLMPRKEYFHHFQQMEQGIGGLMNILAGSHDISAGLAGISEFTKPKGKWWSALQQRTGGSYTEDAIGGMARYIPAAEYKINIDPFIAKMRGNVEALAKATQDTRNANDFIEYLTDWTNDLAGKTNFFDRGFQKALDRKTMKTFEWFNNRAKANAVVGNIGSAIVQIGNIPNATMYVKNPRYWAIAAAKMAQNFNGAANQSRFLQERFLGNELERFQNKSNLQKGAEWLLSIGDEKAARLIWEAAYAQYESGDPSVAGARRSYVDATDYADDITRRSIAGRGIGEMPLMQKSRMIKLFAPFQVEVNNTFNLFKEKIGEADAAAIASYAGSAWVTNALIEALSGRRPLFDPIQALIEAIMGMFDQDEEDERSTAERVTGAVGRTLGEVFGNMPYASNIATAVVGTENSAKIFGEEDPTRYGTGNIAVQTLIKPAAQLIKGENVDMLAPLMAIGPSYGGKQAERMIRGLQNLGAIGDVDYSTKEGFSYNKNDFGAGRSAGGDIQFPISGVVDSAKTLAFGKWAASGGRDYIKNNKKPLSEKLTAEIENAYKEGIEPSQFIMAYAAQREAKGEDRDGNGKNEPLSLAKNQKSAIDSVLPSLTKAQKQVLYSAFGVSEKVW